MSLVVSIAPSSTFPELVRLFNNAFHDDTSMLLRGEEAKSQQAIDEAVSEYELLQQEQGCYHIVVTDTKIGKIIGFARWRMYPNGYEPENPDTIHENAEVIDIAKKYETEFLTKVFEERERLWKAKPVCCKLCQRQAKRLASRLTENLVLDILASDPNHQRRGAATLLIKWGIDKANTMGLPAHLEASESSKEFYERRGFKKVGQIKIDLNQYGLEGEEIIAVMNYGSSNAA